MKTIRLFLLVIIALSFTGEVNASLFAGADLTYRCLGGQSYEITFSLYRDCSGATEPTSVSVSFKCTTNSAYNFSATLNKIPGTGIEVTPGCSALPTSCTGGASSQYGIREYIYRAEVTLPPCNFWEMSYSLCCRNQSNTIVSPTSQSGYIEAILNNLDAPCNSSPTFTNKPITIMCSGKTFCFNHGALDPNGDSLSYEMITPKSSATTEVIWQVGYSVTQPLPGNPFTTSDPVTGDICMTPVMNIVSLMAVLITQWRMINNVPTVVGRNIRDIQLNVVTCPNQIPKLGGMDTTLAGPYKPSDTTYFKEMCLGTTINYNMWGYDADTVNPYTTGHPELFSITWNNGIPSGTFIVYNNGTNHAHANFTWIPNQSHVSNTPHCYTATIQDQACPYFGSQTFNYCIKVLAKPVVTLGPDSTLAGTKSMTLDAGSGYTSYIWSTGDTTQTILVDGGQYSFGSHNFSVTVTNNSGCAGSDFVIITIFDDTGLESSGNKTSVITFPNPSEGEFTIKLQGFKGLKAYLTISDISGKVTINDYIKSDDESVEITFAQGVLPPGVYIVRLISDEICHTGKIIIK